ncbi:hypothetical protein [Vibrio campbellii]|uniref:hypothetical protein n=1 Tax=Vibrio campbellii TaxID=680 RepID=UPI000CD370B1|nr:hypothetical protein [Vibrio campbellii]AUV87422.1 hypothetical protein C1N50_15255 [Vibrio campbellii]
MSVSTVKFLSSKVFSAFGVVLLTYLVSERFDVNTSSDFLENYIVLGFFSIISTFGLSTLVIIDRKLKIMPGEHYRYSLYLFALVFCLGLSGFFVFMLIKFDLIPLNYVILSIPFQSLCLFLSSLLKSRGLINIGSLTEPGVISLLSAFYVFSFDVVDSEHLMLSYFLFSIVIVFSQLLISFYIGTFKVPYRKKYFLSFWLLLRKSYHLFLSSVYIYLNTWVVTLVISSNEKLFVIYNVAVRTASVFNFIINSLNNYFMIKSNGLNLKEQFDLGMEKIERQTISQRPILYLLVGVMTLLFFCRDTFESFISLDVIVLLICMQSVFSFLIVGPTGALCISLGYLKYSHAVNFLILMVQLLFSCLYYIFEVSSYSALISLVFICQFLIAAKDWIYKLCLNKIKEQLY